MRIFRVLKTFEMGHCYLLYLRLYIKVKAWVKLAIPLPLTPHTDTRDAPPRPAQCSASACALTCVCNKVVGGARCRPEKYSIKSSV